VTFKKSPAQPKASRSLKIDVACAMKRKKTGGKSGRKFQVFAERGPEYSGAARLFFREVGGIIKSSRAAQETLSTL
jgi:hypothetical protein